MTMLIVSHEMSFVKEVSSRVVFMDNGSIIEINEPKIIFDNPKEKRTLDFVSKILKDKWQLNYLKAQLIITFIVVHI